MQRITKMIDELKNKIREMPDGTLITKQAILNLIDEVANRKESR